MGQHLTWEVWPNRQFAREAGIWYTGSQLEEGILNARDQTTVITNNTWVSHAEHPGIAGAVSSGASRIKARNVLLPRQVKISWWTDAGKAT